MNAYVSGYHVLKFSTVALSTAIHDKVHMYAYNAQQLRKVTEGENKFLT